MTSEETDVAHEVYLRIAKQLTEYTNKMIAEAGVSPPQEEYIRTLLSETMRFWE